MNTPERMILSSLVILFVCVIYAINLPNKWKASDITPIGHIVGSLGLISIPTLIVSILWEIWIL